MRTRAIKHLLFVLLLTLAVSVIGAWVVQLDRWLLWKLDPETFITWCI